MSRIVAIGRATELAGYALVGVDVVAAEGPGPVREAWEHALADAGLVLLTSEARSALPERLDAPSVLWAVLPR